jgi:hypothetical protein
MESLSGYLKNIAKEQKKYIVHQIRIFFDAPPKQLANKVLDDKGQNFQWLYYTITFSDDKKEKWYIYKTPLEPWGVTQTGGQQVFVSDPEGNIAKNETPDITEEEVKSNPVFEKFLRGPNLNPKLPSETMLEYVQFYNKHEIARFTSTLFTQKIENAKDENNKPFYMMVTKKGLYTPLGQGPFGNKGTPGHFKAAVRLAAGDKGPGFDIMKRLVQKQRTVKTPSHPKEYETGGFSILQDWERKKQKHSPTKTDVNDGFDTMKKLVKHPVKIKK